MSIAAINPIATTNIPGSERIPVQTLNQDDFLHLMITQLANQDPMNPMKDTDFIAQMAQFSALEQSKTMQADMAALRAQNQVLHANGLIGRLVELQTDSGLLTAGIVSGVIITDGVPKLVVNDGVFDLSRVVSVAPAPTPVTPPGSDDTQPTTEQGVQP